MASVVRHRSPGPGYGERHHDYPHSKCPNLSGEAAERTHRRIFSGNDSKRRERRFSRRDRKYVRVRGPREVRTDQAYSAVTYLFRTTGQVLGVSLSGALLQAVLTRKLRERITGPGAIEVSSATYLHDSLLRAPHSRSLSKFGSLA